MKRALVVTNKEEKSLRPGRLNVQLTGCRSERLGVRTAISGTWADLLGQALGLPLHFVHSAYGSPFVNRITSVSSFTQ